MQFWVLNIILLAYCANAVTENLLQCYECLGDECNNINDSMLNYCGPQSTTTQPTTTEILTTSTTLRPSTSTNGNTESTTSTATTTTTSSTTSGSTTTTTTTESSPASTSDDITESTIASTSSLTTETTVSIVETLPTTEVQTYPLRQRRSLPLNPKILPADVLLANYRLRSFNVRADSSWYCYSASIPDGDSSKRKHGCVEAVAEKTPCDAVRELNNIPSNTDANEYDCYTCQTDKCNNGAGHLQGISMLMLLSVLIVQKFSK